MGDDNGRLFTSVGESSPNQDLQFGAMFPQFEATDITGRAWKTADLRGKFTVLYLFHTSQYGVPGPVRRDIPELQRFYDEVSKTELVQVFVFRTDYDYTHARRFMAMNKYSFPVVAKWDLLMKLFPKSDCRQGCGASIPTATGDSIPIATRQWVVDPDGRLSSPMPYWGLNRLLFAVEKAANLGK